MRCAAPMFLLYWHTLNRLLQADHINTGRSGIEAGSGGTGVSKHGGHSGIFDGKLSHAQKSAPER